MQFGPSLVSDLLSGFEKMRKVHFWPSAERQYTNTLYIHMCARKHTHTYIYKKKSVFCFFVLISYNSLWLKVQARKLEDRTNGSFSKHFHHYTSLTGRLASSRSTRPGSCSWVPFLLWGSERPRSVTLEADSLGATTWIL